MLGVERFAALVLVQGLGFRAMLQVGLRFQGIWWRISGFQAQGSGLQTFHTA